MKIQLLLKSRFRLIYMAVLALGAAAIGILFVTFYSIVIPQNTRTQKSMIESMVQSHHNSIIHNNTRSLRDELVTQGFITNDLDFVLLKPSRAQDLEKLNSLLASCTQSSERTCTGADSILIFEGLLDSKKQNAAQFSYVIALNNFKFNRPLVLVIGATLAIVLMGLLMIFVFFAMRREEKALLHNTKLCVFITFETFQPV